MARAGHGSKVLGHEFSLTSVQRIKKAFSRTIKEDLWLKHFVWVQLSTESFSYCLLSNRGSFLPLSSQTYKRWKVKKNNGRTLCTCISLPRSRFLDVIQRSFGGALRGRPFLYELFRCCLLSSGGSIFTAITCFSSTCMPSLLMGTQRQFSENTCSEEDLKSRIFGTFVLKSLACLPLLGFSNI